MTDLAEALVGEEEGRSRTVYKDILGFWSIGIGSCVDPKVPGAGLCDAAIDAQFAHDTAEAKAIAGRYPYFDELSEIRKAVFISMSFQLGSKPLYWPKFMAALRARDYVQAAIAGRDSDWWREQTHSRAEREMRMLESNEWVPKTEAGK